MNAHYPNCLALLTDHSSLITVHWKPAMNRNLAELDIMDLGLVEYSEAVSLQKGLVRERIDGNPRDRLLLVEHPPVITIGRSGDEHDLKLQEEMLVKKGVAVHVSDRGGKATFHGPGQLVAYPIVKLGNKDVHWYVEKLLEVVASLLAEYGLQPGLKDGAPGIWIQDRKIASIGVAIKKWVTSHGIALNVNTQLNGFEFIIPCGMPGQEITSMEKELGAPQDFTRVKDRFIQHFKTVFGYEELQTRPRPEWLILPPPKREHMEKMQAFIQKMHLGTVCQSAHCPNMGECFSKGTATFMILGKYCTRKCRFCAVEKGIPLPPDPQEAKRVAKAVQELGLHYAVITSVTRDDLQDGGADQFVQTIREIRASSSDTRIEILVPDFQGNPEAIERVCSANPDLFNHNLETVARLYALVRPQARYNRSLNVLSLAARYGLRVKSGLMLGLGESKDEVVRALDDLRKGGCEHLTLGQYLAPSKTHIPVSRYLPPEEFEEWSSKARAMGFMGVASGPLVRSSYRAEDFFDSQNGKRAR
jgi:lipoic acid synthetase